MSRTDILITYKIHPETVQRLSDNIKYMPELGFFLSDKSDAREGKELEQRKIEQQTALLERLETLKPRVLIVGSNPVELQAIKAWRKAVGAGVPLAVIRRGVETGGIDRDACQRYEVAIRNTPGINSRPVAKHLLTFLGLEKEPAGSISIIGVGDIGGFIAKQALRAGWELRLYSPSLSRPGSRRQALARAGLNADVQAIIEPSIQAAVKGSRRLAIAIPWRTGGEFNKGAITSDDILSMGTHPVIVSASNPGVFTDAALALMDKLGREDKLKLHIDTGAIYAKDYRLKYPNLEIEHDVAFADEQCQLALDDASLKAAHEFIST